MKIPLARPLSALCCTQDEFYNPEWTCDCKELNPNPAIPIQNASRMIGKDILLRKNLFNSFTSKSDQFQISLEPH